MKKKKYYAYQLPNGERGITDSWPECEKLVKGTANARYQSFTSEAEADAWLRSGAEYVPKERKPQPKISPGIYFDAGTGRGQGVEVSVTDEGGRDLLAKILPKTKINKHGKHPVKNATNNFGELLGAKFALQLALKVGVKKIWGDSKLILTYWSRGYVNDDIPVKTRRLAAEVTNLRQEFESGGGRMEYISGDHNPADLGFHRP